MPKPEETPLMQQWRDAKSRHPGRADLLPGRRLLRDVLRGRRGGRPLLGLTLTSRNNGGAANVPLAGVPVRARDEYIQRLIRLGRRVAICEQVEDPAEAKGIVRREVVETITPGAVLADALLTERRNNHLVALRDAGANVAIAAVDASTGRGHGGAQPGGWAGSGTGAVRGGGTAAAGEPARAGGAGGGGASRTYRPDWLFDAEHARDELRRRYRVSALDGFGFESGDEPLIGALGALLGYLAEVQPAALDIAASAAHRAAGRGMVLDEMTRRNLELVEPLRVDASGRGGRAVTLIEVIDETQTAMGARLLRRWVLRPLTVAERIWERQDAVANLLEDVGLRRSVRGAQGRPRPGAPGRQGRRGPRPAAGTARPADSLARLPAVADALAGATAALLCGLGAGLDALDDVRSLLDALCG
jgi:DNA mismatch repair protein MutS